MLPVSDLKKYAYTEIKRRIISCEYAPGSLLKEQFLSDELNISRTPIREALNRIEHDGLIRIMPKKGIFVQEVTMADISQIYQARSLLEPFVVLTAGPVLSKEKLKEILRLCTEEVDDDKGVVLSRIDTELHLYLVDNCDNRYIIDTMHKIWENNTRIQFYTNNRTRFSSAREEHVSLLSNLIEGDFEAAAHIMREHIENCRNCTFEYLLKWSGYPR